MNNDQEEKLSALEFILENDADVDMLLQVATVGTQVKVTPRGEEEESIEVIAAWTRPDSDG